MKGSKLGLIQVIRLFEKFKSSKNSFMGEMCNQEVKEYMSLKQQNNKLYNDHTMGGTY